MAGNYVEVVIDGKDKLAPVLGEAELQAKAFTRTLNETNRKLIAGNLAAAEAEGTHRRATDLLALSEQVLADGERRLAAEAEYAANRHGFLGTVVSRLTGLFSGGNGAGGLQGALTGTFGAAEQAGTSLGTMGTIIVPLIGLAATLAVAFAPLIASLGLITVGIGTFAAIAVPELSKVWTAVSAGGTALKKLSPQEHQLVGPIRDLKGEFHKLAKAVQPEVLKAFGTGLKIIKDVMPALTPLAVAAGKAINGFLKNVDKWLNSSSGKKFLHWMEVDGPKALATFGKDAWTVAKAIGSVFDFIYNTGKTFDHNWRIFWHDAAKVVDGFRTGFVQMGHLISSDAQVVWHAVTTFVSNFLKGFTQMGHEIGHVASGIATGFTQMGHEIESMWNSLVGAIASAVSKIESIISGLNGALGGIPGKILGALGFASGGIVGAASGGLHSGLRLVGERGPELVQLPAGSRVYNNGQTQQMLGGGGPGQVVIEFHAGGNGLSQEFFTQLANGIRVRGGNPQIVTRKVVFA